MTGPAARRRRSALSSCAALIAAVTLAACGGGGGSGTQPSPLSDLAQNQDAYVGKTVSTSGTVERQRNTDGTAYYVLTDAQQDLVSLRPPGRVERYVGRSVVVTGRFEVDPTAGRVIRLAQVKPAAR